MIGVLLSLQLPCLVRIGVLLHACFPSVMLSILQVYIGYPEVVRAEHVAVVRECALVGVVALLEETLLLLCKSKAV